MDIQVQIWVITYNPKNEGCGEPHGDAEKEYRHSVQVNIDIFILDFHIRYLRYLCT